MKEANEHQQNEAYPPYSSRQEVPGGCYPASIPDNLILRKGKVQERGGKERMGGGQVGRSRRK